MIPILYGADEENFTSNGLGRLADAISCKATEERNGIYEVEMEYPVGGRHFGQLLLSNIIYCRSSQDTKLQAFRIYEVTDAIDGVSTVRAQHISYQLTAIPVEPFTASTPAEAVGYLVDNSVVTNPFTITTDIEEGEFAVETPDSVRAIIGGIEGNMLETWGAEVEWDMYDVYILSSRGENRGKVVRYGKDITNITQEQSIEETVTGIYPYYSDSDGNYVDLAEKVLMASTASLYPYPRIMPVDFTQSFASEPTESELRTKAQEFLDRSSIGFPRVSIEVSYIDDADISTPVYLCDEVRVIFEPLGISTLAKVSKLEWNVLMDRYENLTVGFEFGDIASTVEQVAKRTEQKAQTAIKKSERETQQKIDQITYDYVEPQTKNTGAIAAGSDAIVMACYFKLEAATRVRFCTTVNFETTATISGDMTHLHIIYNVDNTPLNPNDPLIEYYEDGHHILTLDFLTSQLSAGQHSFGVAFGLTNGDLS